MTVPLQFTTALPLPPLLDFTKNYGEFGYVDITLNKSFKPAPDCAPSGASESLPILQSSYHMASDKQVYSKPFGLPYFKFKRGMPANIHFTNKTGYSFNLHWHGLNTPGDTDGATETLEFGVDTYFTTKFSLTIPAITNNSALLWVHAHNMFISAPIMYGGAYGAVLLVDDISSRVTDLFKYGDNHLILAYQDLQLNADGSLTTADIYTDENRNPFGMINGVSCINWYKNGKAPYTTQLYHTSTENLVKIDFVSPTNSFRYYWIGVCDKHDNIKPFTHVQTDGGLKNPIKLTMLGVASAQRVSIIVDLCDFDCGEAYVFFYNFDLTEVYGLFVNDNGVLASPTPDLAQSGNPTPYPTPIPDPSTCDGQTYTNQQGDPTNLTYPPICPYIPQTIIEVPTGNVPAPQQTGQPYSIKKFLKLNWNKRSKKNPLSLKRVVSEIRKIVFGEENYCLYKNIIKQPNFEFNNKIFNYIPMLNPKYFYNIPDTTVQRARNFILNGDDCENYEVNCNLHPDVCASCGGSPNPLGGTEFVNGQNRVFFDQWNSEELDLNYALEQYKLNPNNWKPDILPTVLFKISQTNMEYYNLMMENNDTLLIEFFNKDINYEEEAGTPIASATIIFPPTNPSPPATISKPYNIAQWTALVNQMFEQTSVVINGVSHQLSEFLSYDWTFFPFKMNFLLNATTILKSVLVKTTNSSSYHIRLTATWSLLQFFGKNIGAMPTPVPTGCTNDMFPANKNFYVQTMYVNYATRDPNNPIPTCGCNGDAIMIIKPGQTFKGFYDGFENDNLMVFSVKEDTTEYWIYNNLDTEDSHPLHFHLTQGFLEPKDPINEKYLVDDTRIYYPFTYSLDIYGLPPNHKLAWYLRFPNYNSADTGLNLIQPPQPYLGFMFHCHFMEHHDMNMMGQYFVYKERSEYF